MPLALGSTAGRSLRGRVRVPGDKSISHRALLFDLRSWQESLSNDGGVMLG